MKKVMKFLWVIALCLAPFTLTSCGDDDDNTGGGNNGGGSGSTTSETFKKNLQSCGVNLVSQIDTTSFVEMRGMAQYFLSTYSDYSLGMIDDLFASAMSSSLNLTSGKLSAISDISPLDMISLTSAIYSELVGVYEPQIVDGEGTWVKTSDADNIVFKYTDSESKLCSLSLTMSGENDIVVVEDGNRKSVTLPTYCSVEIKRAGTVVAGVSINQTINNLDLTNANSVPSGVTKIQFNIADYSFVANANVNSNAVTTDVIVKKNTTELIKLTASLSGSNMTNIALWMNNQNAITFGAANAEVVLMSDIKAKAAVSSVTGIIKADKELESSEFELEDFKKYANTMNSLCSISLYKGDTKGCDVKMNAYSDESGDGYNNYTVESILYFSDGTTVAFDDYFTIGNFSEVAMAAYKVHSNFMNFISSFDYSNIIR